MQGHYFQGFLCAPGLPREQFGECLQAQRAGIGAIAYRQRMAQAASAQLPALKPYQRDRKSTRLNSSHLVISYAVFCLKKKNIHTESPILETFVISRFTLLLRFLAVVSVLP